MAFLLNSDYINYNFLRKERILMQTKYKMLANQLTDMVITNLKKGIYKLPTEAELCQRYQVSRQTVRQALTLLASQNLIVSKQGSGSYATGLSVNTSHNIIGLIISSDEEYIYPELIADIRSVLADHGFSLRLFVTENQVVKEREYLEEIIDRPLRGLIVEGCKSALPNPNLDLYEQLHRQELPIIFLHGFYPALPWAVCIKDDNFYGGYLLGQYLFSQGHTQIAALFKMDDIQGIERYQGFITCMRDNGHMVSDDRIGWFTTAQQSALEKKQDTHFLLDFIQKQLKSCSALICYNDEIAYWMIKELQYAGLEIPGDITVVCFDNSYLSELSQVRITTLTHKPHEMGTCVAECMLQALQGILVSSQELPWELVGKESASPPESLSL